MSKLHLYNIDKRAFNYLEKISNKIRKTKTFKNK